MGVGSGIVSVRMALSRVSVAVSGRESRKSGIWMNMDEDGGESDGTTSRGGLFRE
jgi:hypothetical protein